METEVPLEITRKGAWPILKYNVRKPRHWNATVFIDDETGIILIDSDFGQQEVYSHWWSQEGRGKGKSLRQFMAYASGDGYFKDKFSYGRDRFDVEKAEKQIAERCDELIKEGKIDDLDKDEIMDELFNNHSPRTGKEFFQAVQLLWGNNDVFDKHFDFEYFQEGSIGSSFSNKDTEAMVDKVLRPLLNYWKEELQAEEKAKTT